MIVRHPGKPKRSQQVNFSKRDAIERDPDDLRQEKERLIQAYLAKHPEKRAHKTA